MSNTRVSRAAIVRALVMILALAASAHAAVGGWSPPTNPPPVGISTMLLLTDGSVLAQQYYSNRWFRLRPDASGSYVNGAWSAAAAMRDARLYYASTLLRDGRVFVAGGEYGSGGSSVEVYDPRADAWSVVPGWSGDIGDSTAVTLADGRVLLLPRLVAGGSIWDPASGAWSPVAGKLDGDINDEESIVRLPDGSFLAADVWRNTKAQRYLPSANAWVDAGTIPVGLVDSGYEIGPGLRLMDGRAWFIGATGATAFYLPDANAWQAGPAMPGGAKADDAPAAVLPSGRVLCIGDRGGYAPPSALFEFDPASGAYTALPAPWDGFTGRSAYEYRMLVLPTGQVLMSDGSGHLGFYTSPDGPSDAWRPAISSLSDVGDGTTRIVGTQLTGLNDGAAYGDDAQMASNYPIARLRAGGQTWYARTGNFSTLDIATQARPVSADVSVAGIPDGSYALEAVANGIASAPVTVTVAGGRIVTRGPYGGVARAIPGTIEAEDFDVGGEGVAYHDLDPTNNGGGYRDTGVDVRACYDAGGGWQVGWFGGGEWLEYTVNVTATGAYDLAVRVASGADGATIHLSIDGADVTGPLSFANTGGWDSFTTVQKLGVPLSAGLHVLRLTDDGGALDCNWISASVSGGLVSGASYQVFAKHSGKCLAVAGSSTENAAGIWQWSDDGTTGEIWRLDAQPDGSWELIARCSGDALDMGGWSTDLGGRAIQWPLHGGDNQRWRIEPTGGGWYRLVNVHSGLVLDVSGVSPDDGAAVIQWSYWGGDNQQWRFVPVPPTSVGRNDAARPADGAADWTTAGVRADDGVTLLAYARVQR